MSQHDLRSMHNIKPDNDKVHDPRNDWSYHSERIDATTTSRSNALMWQDNGNDCNEAGIPA